MRITTWNVNSIHARRDPVLDWIERNKPDVLLLQETKTTDQEFPVDDLGDLGYDCVFTGERSYNGVAICARAPITAVHKTLPGDPADAQRRYISGVVEGVRLVCVYVPHGQALGSDKYAYKLAWLARLAEQVTTLGAPGAPLVVSGDYNVAQTDALDVWDARALAGSTHVSEPERAAIAALLARGLVDAQRHLHPDRREFSWWDYRQGGFDRDHGMRIDLHLVTPALLPRVRAVDIDRVARTEDKASDHAPVTLTLSA